MGNMSWAEFLTFCLVLLTLVDLIIRINDKKK